MCVRSEAGHCRLSKARDRTQKANGLVSLSCCGGWNFMEILHCSKIDSTIGPLFLAASSQGLVALEFDARASGQQSIRPNPRDLREEKKSLRFEDSPRIMRPYIRELEGYS